MDTLWKRWFLPAAARARGQSNDLNREILASNLFNCCKEVINAPPVPSISRCIHIVYRHKTVWEYQWSNFIYNCMSTFLHYVHCKDALLDCSAPGGERCESLTRVDEISSSYTGLFQAKCFKKMGAHHTGDWPAGPPTHNKKWDTELTTTWISDMLFHISNFEYLFVDQMDDMIQDVKRDLTRYRGTSNVNSFASRRGGKDFQVSFKLFLQKNFGIRCKIASTWMLPIRTNERWTLVQIMAWCRLATSQYMGLCCSRSMSHIASLGHNEFKHKSTLGIFLSTLVYGWIKE